MAASDHLNKRLFHGTGGAIEGGIVRPTASATGMGAFATPSNFYARFYAANKAAKEGRLFGVVYEVTPMSDPSDLQENLLGADVEIVDPKGLKTGKVVDFPLNRKVRQ